jgi:AraC family transcriptional regulator, regulatory protein of adaptative response / methylated-DNA-[protein]-cysteine methyltransferase
MNTPAENYVQLSEDYVRIEKAIRYIEENYRSQPDLSQVAASIGLSEYHFQRLFTQWVGISPKRFLQFLTKEHAKELLENSSSVLDAAYETGLSGPGRLHDLFITYEAVTPGEYKKKGAGLTIHYGFHPSPFGECLIAVTGRGICNLAFVETGDRQVVLAALNSSWLGADLLENGEVTRPYVALIFGMLDGEPKSSISLYLKGTSFQLKVWEALLMVPAGSLVSYGDLARKVGIPGAARAVGNAVGDNPIPVLIPCHRVIRNDGFIGSYRYGSARKKALLGWEMAHSIV